jgi:hypothetical protein
MPIHRSSQKTPQDEKALHVAKWNTKPIGIFNALDCKTQIMTWYKTLVGKILSNATAEIVVPGKIEEIRHETRDPILPKHTASSGAASLMIAVPDGRHSIALPVSISNQKERILAGITNAIEKTRLKISDIQVTIEEHIWIQEIYSILTQELFEEIRKVEGAESKIIIGEKWIKMSGWMDFRAEDYWLSFTCATLESFWNIQWVEKINITQTREHFWVAHGIPFQDESKLVVTLQAHYGKDCTPEYRENITKGFREILERSVFPKILEWERLKSQQYTDEITGLPNQVAFRGRYNNLKQTRTPFQVTKMSMILSADFAIYWERGEEMSLLLMSDLIKRIDFQENPMLTDTAYHVGKGVILLVSTSENEGEVPFISTEIRKFNLSLKVCNNLQIAMEQLSQEKTFQYASNK